MTTMTLDPRNPATHQAAEMALADASTAAETASAAVDEAREKVAMGRARVGDVLKAQRRHAEAVERRENARAAIRALARERERVLEAERQERDAVRQARAAELLVEHDALEAQIAGVIAAALDGLHQADDAIKDWSSRAQGVRGPWPGPGSLSTPSDLGRVWGPAIAALGELRRIYPGKGQPR